MANDEVDNYASTVSNTSNTHTKTHTTNTALDASITKTPQVANTSTGLNKVNPMPTEDSIGDDDIYNDATCLTPPSDSSSGSESGQTTTSLRTLQTSLKPLPSHAACNTSPLFTLYSRLSTKKTVPHRPSMKTPPSGAARDAESG